MQDWSDVNLEKNTAPLKTGPRTVPSDDGQPSALGRFFSRNPNIAIAHVNTLYAVALMIAGYVYEYIAWVHFPGVNVNGFINFGSNRFLPMAAIVSHIWQCSSDMMPCHLLRLSID